LNTELQTECPSCERAESSWQNPERNEDYGAGLCEKKRSKEGEFPTSDEQDVDNDGQPPANVLTEPTSKYTTT